MLYAKLKHFTHFSGLARCVPRFIVLRAVIIFRVHIHIYIPEHIFKGTNVVSKLYRNK